MLRVISSSPGELQPVFDAMLENAVRICDATYGNIYSRDGEIFRLVASHKTPPAFTEYRRRNPMTGSGAHWADPMLRSKTQVHIADLALERGFIERDPSFVAAVELGGARSALAVPMLKEGETHRRVRADPPGSSAIHREANRAGHELRRASGDRDREHAALKRAAPTHG